MIAGALFTEDYLREGVRAHRRDAVCLAAAPALAVDIEALFAGAGDPARLNEAQTEDAIIRPILDRLGWKDLRVVQVAASVGDVPDYVLFPDEAAFADAQPLAASDKFRHAIAVADAKAWRLALDQRGAGAGRNETPAGQILRYMDRAAARSSRCRWGILTNGRVWRLYWQGSADRLGAYFQVDLAAVLGGPEATAPSLFGLCLPRDEALALFLLFFGREGFGASQQIALDEGRLWETRVRQDLAAVVFDRVYPGLLRGLIAADPQRPAALTPAYLSEAREAALTALYRLLFLVYAEDRELLPRRDARFHDYSLTETRERVAERLDAAFRYSTKADDLWRRLVNLFRMIDEGEDALGVPAYNGKLFAADRAPLIERARLSDQAFAPLLDALSRRREQGALKWINYRDLSVRELGSIYERLLEYEAAADASAPAGVAIRLNAFARKGSGSYYTPDSLVRLIIERTLRPLVVERLEAFEAAVARGSDRRLDPGNRRAWLDEADPASAILALKVCDPAMGSGHFLVDLVDWLSAEALKAIGGAESKAEPLGLDWRSPMAGELERLRETLREEAKAHGWPVRAEQLADANLIKRLTLKRCVHGIDKNPMAVELAKVALWLHTFTAGAPLSFLDHHLRRGDSLFGEWVDEVAREAESPAANGNGRNGRRARAASPIAGAGLFLGPALSGALGAEQAMRAIERLSDGALAEVEESALNFAQMEAGTARLKAFLDFRHALRWIARDEADAKALAALLDGQFGDPLAIVAGQAPPKPPPGVAPDVDEQLDWAAVEAAPEQMALLPGGASGRDFVRARRLIAKARALAEEQRFLHWQVAFPGVWKGWRDARSGGFDAVVGNPPWDRMKMQEVEWFAERAPAIARQVRAADRKSAIAALRAEDDPLAAAYDLAADRAETAMRVAREGGAYPLLSRGDINLYALFVERAQALIKPGGAAGLLTPSGIASDLTAAPFFQSLSTAGRVLTLFDFENRRGDGREHFFPDVDSRFKFCAFIAGGRERTTAAADCAFFLRDPPAPDDPSLFRLTAADFARVNPNTGTAPIFRSERDAEITRAIYGRLPVLVDRSSGEPVKAWPVKYMTMFHMANDSAHFWTRAALQDHGAYEIGGGLFAKGDERYVPLLTGRAISQFNHRHGSAFYDDQNAINQFDHEQTSETDLENSDFFPSPVFWVEECMVKGKEPFRLAFRDISRSTDVRTMMACVGPPYAYGHKAPLIERSLDGTKEFVPPLCANLNSLILDFVLRQKYNSTSLTWFIVEQLPVIPPDAYERRFGARTAGEIVRDHVLRLSYTAHDLAAFARDLGHVDPAGEVLPPFPWDEAERRQLRARLDALYFQLYGVTEPGDVDHVLASFPIVERKDRAAFDGVYLTRELIHWHLAALAAGDSGRDAPETDLIAAARRRQLDRGPHIA